MAAGLVTDLLRDGQHPVGAGADNQPAACRGMSSAMGSGRLLPRACQLIVQHSYPARESMTSVRGVDGIYMLGRAVKSIRSESGLAVITLEPLSPQRIGGRIETEFFTNSLGELIRVLAFVVEISSLRK